ncbi:methyltransferase [Catenovulum sediminis]|uniref:Methyltransferase n=1 Tax=Catenovulum sediminis TaxID=1740262 RepID=A0ABV1RMG7_9ALTE|nr:methyltransferase [Catenovulum sediminis]
MVDPIDSTDLMLPQLQPCHVWKFRDICGPQKEYFLYPSSPCDTYQCAVVFFPKAKEKALWLFRQLSQILADNTLLYIVGDNKSGIKTLPKFASGVLTNIQKLASGKHCILYQAVTQKEDYSEALKEEYVEYQVGNKPITVASMPGVFSHRELDHGTRLLLTHLPDNIEGEVLDFACGCGVIGSYIKKYYENVNNITLTDIDAIAVEASKMTLKCNELVGHVVLSDGLKKISSKYRWIFSNPPFHTGLKIDYHITEAFIKRCKEVLQPGGCLYLVANRFLKYPHILQNHFDLIEVVVEDNKFKVYCAYNR